MVAPALVRAVIVAALLAGAGVASRIYPAWMGLYVGALALPFALVERWLRERERLPKLPVLVGSTWVVAFLATAFAHFQSIYAVETVRVGTFAWGLDSVDTELGRWMSPHVTDVHAPGLIFESWEPLIVLALAAAWTARTLHPVIAARASSEEKLETLARLHAAAYGISILAAGAFLFRRGMLVPSKECVVVAVIVPSFSIPLVAALEVGRWVSARALREAPRES